MSDPEGNRSTVQGSRPGARQVAVKFSLVAPIVVALATLVTVVGIRQSLLIGRLATVPQYDDVSYFLAATQWSLALPSRSVGESLYSMLAQHAPFATETALLGFLLVPDGYVGPYAMNGLVLAIFLAGCARLIWALPLTAIAACLVGLACIPLLTQVVGEARPDLPWGLALGLILVATVHRPLVTQASRRVFLLGVLAGAATAIKPTALPASMAYVVVTIGIGLLCDFRDEGRPLTRAWAARSCRTAGIYLAGFTLLLAPIVIVQNKTLLNYILNTLIYNKEFWRYEGDPSQQLTFYFGMLRLALGWWLWIGIALFAVRLATSFCFDRRDFRRALALLAVLIWAYLAPTLSEMKTFYVGGSIYGVFIVAMVVNFASVFDRLDRAIGSQPRVAWKFEPMALGRMLRINADLFAHVWWLIARRFVLGALLPALAVFSLALDLRSGRIRTATVFQRPWIEDTINSTARVWENLRQHTLALKKDEQMRQRVTVTFSSPDPVNPTVIQLYAARAGISLDARNTFFRKTPESAIQDMLASDYGVVSSSISHNLPGPRMGDDIIRALDSSPGVCIVDSFPQAIGGIVRVYRNRRLGCPAGSN